MKVDFLKKRAEEFLETVNYHLKRGQNNLAAFNLEQAYITSRCLPAEFSKNRMEKMKFLRILIF